MVPVYASCSIWGSFGDLGWSGGLLLEASRGGPLEGPCCLHKRPLCRQALCRAPPSTQDPCLCRRRCGWRRRSRRQPHLHLHKQGSSVDGEARQSACLHNGRLCRRQGPSRGPSLEASRNRPLDHPNLYLVLALGHCPFPWPRSMA